MSPDELNLKLADIVRGRTDRMSLYGSGIRLASDYVRGVLDAAGSDGAVAFPDAAGMVKEAENRLVYRNDDMAYEPPMTSMGAIAGYCKSIGVDTPPRCLMVFENIVTTSKEDRDGDILRSEGAMVDPQMPLLWHHMLPAIVGKMLSVREQNSNHVRVASAIMESPLGNDVANLIEFGALRISHGFRPLDFRPREKGLRNTQVPRGYDIRSYEMLEESVVSVPSNVGGVITAWSRGKLCTPMVKAWAKSLNESRPDKVYAVGVAIGGAASVVGMSAPDANMQSTDQDAYTLGTVTIPVNLEIKMSRKNADPTEPDGQKPTPTDEDVRLGADAKRQKESGDNPPSWAVDEALWERAKKAADKSYDESDEAYWPVVVTIYRNMGGTIQGDAQKSVEPEPKPAAKPEEKVMDPEVKTALSSKAMGTEPDEEGDGEDTAEAKCPECGETVTPDADGKCPECGAAMKKPESKSAESDAEKSPAPLADKAGRVLSTANEAAIRTAAAALQAVLDQVGEPEKQKPGEPPATDKPDEQPPREGPPVELNLPDSSLSLQAACQTVVTKLFDLDPADTSAEDVKIMRRTNEALGLALEQVNRAKRRRAVEKVFSRKR